MTADGPAAEGPAAEGPAAEGPAAEGPAVGGLATAATVGDAPLRDVLPRPRRRALLLAAATLWLPGLLPLLLGQFAGQTHTAKTFATLLPLMPGIVFAVLCQSSGVVFVLAAAVPTLAAFLALYLAAREMPRGLLVAVQSFVIVAVAAEAFGLAYLVRM